MFFIYEWPLKILPVFLQKACLFCGVTCWLQYPCPLFHKLAMLIHCKISCLLMGWAWRPPYPAAVELARSPYLSSMAPPAIISLSVRACVSLVFVSPSSRRSRMRKKSGGKPITFHGDMEKHSWFQLTWDHLHIQRSRIIKSIFVKRFKYWGPTYGSHLVVRILQAIWAGVESNSTIKLHQTTCELLTGAQYRPARPRLSQ